MEDVLRRLQNLEWQLSQQEQQRGKHIPHSGEHEIAGSDTVRVAVQNGGTLLNRQRTLNLEDGLDAVENSASQRIDIGLADEGTTSRKWAPTVIEQRCTTNTTVSSGVDTDITGATITLTPAIASMALVVGVFDMEVAAAGEVFVIYLDVDGANEGASLAHKAVAASDRQSLAQVWVVPLTAASHTLKLQAARASGTGNATIYATNTKLVLMLMADANVTNDASS